MSAGDTYLEGATVRVQATFQVDDTDTDPTTVTLKVKDPSGNVDTYTYGAGEVTKSATGVYYKDIMPDEVGHWVYRWIGTGTAAGVSEAIIEIEGSDID